MPNAIQVLDSRNLTIGRAKLGRRGDGIGTVKQQVHDGDTISVRADGNFGVRLLGIDTPEISFRLPKQQRFISISNADWDKFLTSPLDEKWGKFDARLPAGLRGHLENRTGEGAAANHHRHAKAAEDMFEELVARDIKVMQQDADEFGFFLVFAFEIMDSYGRLLCYINREQPDPNRPTPRPPSYNTRLLASGAACPYFIWPNVDPWRKADSIVEAVLKPNTARIVVDRDLTLSRDRRSVQSARQRHLGIFDAMDPLMLEPFELRFLARRSLPHRWVIDLSANDNELIQPANYHRIANPEDRLFIPEEYVPLFVEKGWRREKS